MRKKRYVEMHGNNMLKVMAYTAFYDHLITVFVW